MICLAGQTPRTARFHAAFKVHSHDLSDYSWWWWCNARRNGKGRAVPGSSCSFNPAASYLCTPHFQQEVLRQHAPFVPRSDQIWDACRASLAMVL
jgi:hypothetical protein